ncbi:hypothetical protein PINS_up018368 [Pythium insidiosum]|nr:hypothetical protein PINS_up018368 [Pythium insidiosum]
MHSQYSTFGDAADVAVHTADEHPQARAWCVSRALLSWVSPLIALGNRKQLDGDDIWPLQRAHQAAVVSTPFARDYEATQSIVRAFLRSFGWRFVLTGVAFFVSTASTLVGPLVLNHVVSALSAHTYDVRDLLTWILGLLATQLVQALADNYANFDSEVIAIQFTGALKNLIYRKTLKLDAEARREKSVGDITNMYTTDCEMILMAAYFVHQLWLVPLQVVGAGVLLYRLLGPASFAGFGVILLVFLVNHFLSTKIFELYMEFMERKDARLKAVTEVFKSITIVKFNAWEDKFLARIGEARAREVSTTWLFMKLNAASVVLTWGLPVFISVASFGVYSGVMKRQLTPAVVFTSVALFQIVQIPLRFITDIIAALVKAKVAEQRIGEFLKLPEIDAFNVRTIHHPDADKFIARNVIVSVEKGSFGWEHDDPLLHNVNLEVKVGDFVVIHGPVGCGKSSLCAALIGDMIKTNGTVYVGGSMAYCSQQAWIQHMSVRDNILFGRPYDRKKYAKVLEACALTKDLASLPAGDKTEIGERGVNLSGGQKARVALARACYSDASIYVLDAPLSAVDAIVQNEIFQKCLLGLLRHRTIILVTHNPEIISSPHVTRAVTIDEIGHLVETRKSTSRPAYEPAMTPLASLSYLKDDRSYVEHDSSISRDEVEETSAMDPKDLLSLTDCAVGLRSPLRPRAPSLSAYSDDDGREGGEADEKHRLINDEERSQGRVGLHVFSSYYRAVGGLPVLLIILLSQALWQGLQIMSDFWLSEWSTQVSSPGGDLMSQSRRMTIYSFLGLTSALMVVVRTLTVSWCGLSAAKRLFDKMTAALIHAPMKFFDANPIGRILMRYSNDVSDVDVVVPLSFGGFFANLFSVGCSVATTAVIIQWKGIFLIPIVVLYVHVASVYLHPAREIERVLKTTEAPILSHLSESVEGGSIIRAFGTEQVMRFQSTNNIKLDLANKVWFARLCVSRWFGLRIQLLGSVLVFAVAYSLVLLHNQLSAAIVGLAFAYVLKVSQSMERIIQAWSSVETTMVSPERMQLWCRAGSTA